MADPPLSPDANSDTGDDTRVWPDRGATTSTPRWVKVFGIIIIVLVLLVGLMLLTGVGGDHGPGRHLPSGGAGGHTQPLAHGVHLL
jgi:hypothetical protein